jgi:hypothetical protein
LLSDITLGDLPTGTMTYPEMMERMPAIENDIVSRLIAQIERII